jgi:NADH-quinone oxidoreductase subunit L
VVELGCLHVLAACGKSAQVPLQSWLLDSMEGPTPVSALIHAATMVTAGVYLVVRSQAIFGLTPEASLAVAIVGVVTLWVGAWIGSAKDDIKKVLAGSTMSQIGYMMLAAGIGPAGAAFAIFHLLTHGAFKANMFLGAGSVMHATQDDTDMRHFGALRKVMPYTFWTFACGYLAIIGFPFLSGFYSKDHIITAAFERNVVFGVLALAGAGITAFYMTRLVMMTFFGSSRWVDGVQPHESPAVMTVPLIVLAVLSVGLGAALNGWIQQWLAPATGAQVVETSLTEFSTISIATLVVVALGVGLGWWLYRGEIAPVAEPTSNFFVNAGRNELYANQVNEAVFMTPGQGLVSSVALTDDKVVDGAIRGDSWLATAAANGLRLIQNGYVRTYGLTMLIGVVVIGVVLMLGRLA